jgi:hypothetical protein
LKACAICAALRRFPDPRELWTAAFCITAHAVTRGKRLTFCPPHGQITATMLESFNIPASRLIDIDDAARPS